MRIGDTNKRYIPVTNQCYATGAPIKAGHPTTVIISPTGDNTADIYNGFIYAQMKIPLRLSQAATKDKSVTESVHYHVWVGFKDSFDAIEKYEIFANGISIYQQTYSLEESFITSSGYVEALKKSDGYSKTRHKDIWKQSYGYKSGKVLDLVDTVDGKVLWEPVIPLKIDLRRFLPLSNIKYLPAFAGKIELKITFSTKGLVYCPIDPRQPYYGNYKRLSNIVFPDVSCEFTPIGEPITCITGCTASGSVVATFTAEERTIYADSSYEVLQCESTVFCFGIADNIYQSLVSRYMNQDLTFPTQTISVFPCNGILSGETAQTGQTITPRFVDSIFFLFPLKPSYRTVYKNPCFDHFQINCAGYGNMPPQAIPTFDDPRLMEYTQNALNLNTDTFTFSSEVARSLMEGTAEIKKGSVSKDATNFIIGFPTETDGTFQQGHTSNVSISYNINVSQKKGNHYASNVQCAPLICMLVDSVISIQVRPGGAPSEVRVGAYDITSPEMVEA
nr:hypothetical protein [Catenibacterium mitsuokai]